MHLIAWAFRLYSCNLLCSWPTFIWKLSLTGALQFQISNHFKISCSVVQLSHDCSPLLTTVIEWLPFPETFLFTQVNPQPWMYNIPHYSIFCLASLAWIDFSWINEVCVLAFAFVLRGLQLWCDFCAFAFFEYAMHFGWAVCATRLGQCSSDLLHNQQNGHKQILYQPWQLWLSYSPVWPP